MSLFVMPTIQQRLLAAPQFKDYVVKKIGIPLLQDSFESYSAFPNAKWGAFLDGTSAIAKDTTNLLGAGGASAQMTTDAVSGHNAEIKTTMFPNCDVGDLLSMELLYVTNFAFGGTAFDFGIESRDNVRIIHSRARYTITSGRWRFEQPDLTYGDFPASIGGNLPVEKATISTSVGDIVGWVRIIVDPINKLWVGLQAGGKNGKIETRDMRSLVQPMSIGGTSTVSNYLFFALINAGANGAEVANITNLCIARIPQGINPF